MYSYVVLSTKRCNVLWPNRTLKHLPSTFSVAEVIKSMALGGAFRVTNVLDQFYLGIDKNVWKWFKL